MPPTPTMTTAQAEAILAPFNCLVSKGITTAAEKTAVQQALLHLQTVTDTHLFGILAENRERAITALRSYAQAFGYPVPEVGKDGEGAVYIKFNPSTGLCYTSPYTGNHRGVLIAFQSDFADGLNQMCGHLPLDLFDT